jgi:hypothetical protein
MDEVVQPLWLQLRSVGGGGADGEKAATDEAKTTTNEENPICKLLT